MKTFFISYTSEAESVILEERIKLLGEYYVYSRNQFFVSAQFESAEALYKAIVKTDFTNLSILIISVGCNVSKDFWGVEKKELWTWLGNHNV